MIEPTCSKSKHSVRARMYMFGCTIANFHHTSIHTCTYLYIFVRIYTMCILYMPNIRSTYRYAYTIRVYDVLEFVKVEERQIIKSTEQILLACLFLYFSFGQLHLYLYTLCSTRFFLCNSLSVTRSLSTSLCFNLFSIATHPHHPSPIQLQLVFLSLLTYKRSLFNKTYTLCSRTLYKIFSVLHSEDFHCNISGKRMNVLKKTYQMTEEQHSISIYLLHICFNGQFD